MRYLTAIALALVVLMVLACTEQSPHGWTPLPENTISPASSATYVPRYTDSQVIGFIQKHLNTTATYSGSDYKCSTWKPFSHPQYVLKNSTVRNTGPQEQYYVTLPYNGITFTWTFFGGAGQVLPTSINKKWSLEFC